MTGESKSDVGAAADCSTVGCGGSEVVVDDIEEEMLLFLTCLWLVGDLGAVAVGIDDASAWSLKRRILAFGDETTGPAIWGSGALAYCKDRANPFESV